MSFNSEIGFKIQTAREEKNISQDQLARALGCSQSALSNYEKGKRRLYLSQLEKLSEILEKPLEYFVETSSSMLPASPANNRDEQILALINETNQLTDEQMVSVFDYIHFLQWKNKRGE